MSRNLVDSDGIWNALRSCQTRCFVRCARLTPCFAPKYAPMAERGAEIPNQSTTISNIVPNGTAPEEPAIRRDRLSRKTMAKINLDKALSVQSRLRRDICSRRQDGSGQERIFPAVRATKGHIHPAREVSTHTTRIRQQTERARSLCTHPPKKVQQIIITVASDPRLDGDKKPSSAKTIPSKHLCTLK